jgi:hypothetical protein
MQKLVIHQADLPEWPALLQQPKGVLDPAHGEGRTLEERRKQIRRQADCHMMERLAQLEKLERRLGADPEDAKRKRRHAIRHNCRAVVQVTLGHAPGFSGDWSVDAIELEGRVLDLSLEGASLFTRQDFSPGQWLMVGIKPNNGDAIHVRSSVRWIKAIPEKGGFASGVKFKDVPPSEEKKIMLFLDGIIRSAGL